MLQKNDSFDLLTSFESSLAYFHTYPDLSEFETPVFQPNIPKYKTILQLAGNIEYLARTDIPLSLKCKNVQLSQSNILKQHSVLQKSYGSNLEILDITCQQSNGSLSVGKDKQLKRFQFTLRELLFRLTKWNAKFTTLLFHRNVLSILAIQRQDQLRKMGIYTTTN